MITLVAPGFTLALQLLQWRSYSYRMPALLQMPSRNYRLFRAGALAAKANVDGMLDLITPRCTYPLTGEQAWELIMALSAAVRELDGPQCY